MTRDEAKKIVMVIASTYPNWHPPDMSLTVDAWASVLDCFTYQEISAALKAFIVSDTSGFAPAPGQIVGLLDRAANNQELSEMEAWALVSKAPRNGCYGAEQEFEKLPPLVQKVVGAPSQLRNWSQTDSESVENVIQSNFMRTYRYEVAKNREMRKIPQNLLETLAHKENEQIESK